MTIRELVAKHRPPSLTPRDTERVQKEARRLKRQAVKRARKANR